MWPKRGIPVAAKIEERKRSVIEMKYLAGMARGEIAEALHISPPTVRGSKACGSLAAP
jgi:DNA-directed RNA polymerase specialized sigma24 family protein